MQQAILILGMHRSGTSALTRVVNLLGAELNPELMKPHADQNQRGFWESEEIMRLHDELLEALGTTWDETVPLPDGWWLRHEAAALRERLLGLLRRDFANAPLWAIKDPRMCRLLPLWIDVLNELRVQPCCLMIVRNPGEVVDSLQRRSGFSPGLGYPLWLDHVLTAEQQSRGLPRAFLSFEELLDDWRRPMERAAKSLGIAWPNSPDSAAAKIEAFLSPSLRREKVPDTVLHEDPALSPLVLEAYGELSQVASDGNDSEAFRARCDALLERMRDAQLLYGRSLASYRAESRVGRRELSELKNTKAEARRERDATQAAHRDELHKRDQELLRANALFDEHRKLKDEELQRANSLFNEHRKLKDAELQQANHTFSETLERKAEQIINISELLEARTRELEHLRSEFGQQKAELDRSRQDDERAGRLAAQIDELRVLLQERRESLATAHESDD